MKLERHTSIARNAVKPRLKRLVFVIEILLVKMKKDTRLYGVSFDLKILFCYA